MKRPRKTFNQIYLYLIVTLFFNNAYSNFNESLNSLTSQIVKSMPEKGGKIAVFDFSSLEGQKTDFGKFIAEELITGLFMSKKFEAIIERRLLYRILEEQKLTLSDIFDSESIKELGKILGIDAIVTGTITDLGPKLRINSRIISTETAKVVGAASVYIIKTNKVRLLLGEKLPGRLKIYTYPRETSIFFDEEFLGKCDNRGFLIETTPDTHFISIQMKGFKDFNKELFIEENTEKTLKVKFSRDYFAPFKACILSAIIPFSGAIYDPAGIFGNVAGISGLLFYPAALIYLIDKKTPEDFLSEDMKNKYYKTLDKEYNFMKYCYLTNVIFGFLSGLDYAITHREGTQIYYGLDNQKISIGLCYNF